MFLCIAIELFLILLFIYLHFKLKEADLKLSDGMLQLQDGEKQLLDGKEQLEDGKYRLSRGEKEFSDKTEGNMFYEFMIDQFYADEKREAQVKLSNGHEELERGQKTYNEGLKKYEDGMEEYSDGMNTYNNWILFQKFLGGGIFLSTVLMSYFLLHNNF